MLGCSSALMSVLLHALLAWSALLHGGTTVSSASAVSSASSVSTASAWTDDGSVEPCAERNASVVSPLAPDTSRLVPRPTSVLERGELEVEPKLESFECTSASSATYARADSVPELASIAPREADAPRRQDVSATFRRLRGPPRR